MKPEGDKSPRNWRDIAKEIQSEKDSTKVEHLAEELNKALDEIETRRQPSGKLQQRSA